MSNNPNTAQSFVDKLVKGDESWIDFEVWPDGSGMVRIDANVQLTPAEVVFLSTLAKPNAARGPGGDDMPDDFADDDGLK
jgi:hypothetical protein